MTIAIIGGMTSLKGHYQDLADVKDMKRNKVSCIAGSASSGSAVTHAEKEQITIKVIDQAERKAQGAVESSDAVIIITGAVSHQAVKKIKSDLGKKKSESRARTVVYTRSPSMSNISAEVRKLVEGY